MLLAGRRKRCDEDEALFVETVMPALDGNLRTRMLKLAQWQTREPGDVLVEEGQARRNWCSSRAVPQASRRTAPSLAFAAPAISWAR